MVRNFIKNISERLRSAFSSKVFSKKTKTVSKKVKTPQFYYRAKEKQQASAKKRK